MSKFLIDSNFKLTRKGEFVVADEEAGEFILDTESVDYSAATLKEVATKNKIKIPSKANKEDIVSILEDKLNLIKKVPEVNKMTDTQIAEEIIEAGHETKTDDEMLVQIVNAGVSFKNAAKLFKTVMEAKGYRIAAKDRATAAAKILDEAGFDPKKWDDVDKAAANLVREVADTNTKQAMNLLKKYAKTNNIELPKKEKSEKAPGGFRGKLLDFVATNALSATDKDIVKWIEDQEKDEPQKVFDRSALVINAIRKAADLVANPPEVESSEAEAS